MQIRIGPSEAFTHVVSENEQRDEIFDKGMLNPKVGVIDYYGSEDEDGMQKLEEENQQELEPPIDAIPRNDHISQFLKIPRVLKRTTMERKHEPLIDYSSS